MPVRAVSIDELTGGGPVVVFTPTIADACLACGALLAACFAHRGALLVTTLAATSPAWMAAPARPASLPARRAGARRSTADDGDREGMPDAPVAPATRLAHGDGLLAPLIALGGSAASVKALSVGNDTARADRARPDRTSEDIAELCRALGVRSLFMPLTRHRSSRHAGIVEAAVLRVQAADERVRTWRYPAAGRGATQDRTPEPERPVRMLDTTPWREPKRRALVHLDAAGFELPPVAGTDASTDGRPARLATEPERYLRGPGA